MVERWAKRIPGGGRIVSAAIDTWGDLEHKKVALLAMIAMIGAGITITAGFFQLMITLGLPMWLSIVLTIIVSGCYHAVDTVFNLVSVKSFENNESKVAPPPSTKKNKRTKNPVPTWKWIATIVTALFIGVVCFVDTYGPALALLKTLGLSQVSGYWTAFVLIAAIVGGLLNFMLNFKPSELSLPKSGEEKFNWKESLFIFVGTTLIGGFAFWNMYFVFFFFYIYINLIICL